MIVVVGSPHLQVGDATGVQRAAGLAAGVAVGAAAAGGDVQLVGKTGDDPAGDVILLDLAARGVGHVAVLRDPSRPTPETAAPDADAEPFDEPESDPQKSTETPVGPTLEPADIELGLRYLPDYRVVVVADPLPPAALDVVLAASRWSGAALVIVLTHGSDPVDIPDATILEAPQGDPVDAFASVVGGYAAALDRGEEPAEAFASASKASGWATAATD